jgi:hypothetical protein
MDITRATAVDQQTAEAIQDLFSYRPFDQDQTARSNKVREALVAALVTIIEHVPPCPDRSAAIRKLREARMDANSAISFRGKY